MAQDVTNLVFQLYDGVAEIGQNRFRCIQCEAVFGINELARAQFVIIPAENDASGLIPTYTRMFNVMRTLPYGTEVVISFKMKGQIRAGQPIVSKLDYRVFKGVLEGWGTMTLKGVPVFTVWASHWLAALGWGTAIVDKIHGSGLSDWNVPCVYADKEAIVPYSQGSIKATDLSMDAWKRVIKPLLLKLLDQQTFGQDNSAKAKAVLTNDELDSSELPLTLTEVDNPLDVLIDIQRTLLLTENDETSIWEKLVQLGVRYKFAIVPKVNTFSIAPVTYTLGGKLSNFTMLAKNLDHLQDPNSALRYYNTEVDGFEDFSAYSLPFDVVCRKRHASSQLAGDRFRLVDIKLPPWSYLTYSATAKTALTMGLVERRLRASGFMIKTPQEKAGQTLNQVYNTLAGKGAAAYLQTELSERIFRDRTALLRGPLFLDYAPGSQIVYEVPGSANTPTEVQQRMLGCVRRVCVSVDSVISSRNLTWLIVSHVRNEAEQTNLSWESHPLYRKRWVRTPLAEVRELAEPAEVG